MFPIFRFKVLILRTRPAGSAQLAEQHLTSNPYGWWGYKDPTTLLGHSVLLKQ